MLIAQVPLGHDGGLHVGRQRHPQRVGGESDIGRRGHHARQRDRSPIILPGSAKRPRLRAHQVDFIDHGRIGRQPLEEPGFGSVIEHSRADAEGVATVAAGIPYQAQPRREVAQFVRGESSRNARIAVVEHARRRVWIDLAVVAGQEVRHREGRAAVEVVGGVQHRLPTQADVHGHLFADANGVLAVESGNPLPVSRRLRPALVELAQVAEHHVGHGVPGEHRGSGPKKEAAVRLVTGEGVDLGANEIRAEGDLVPPSNQVDVVRELERVDVEVRGRAGLASGNRVVGKPSAAELNLDIVRDIRDEVAGGNTHAPVADHLWIGSPVVAAPGPGGVERVHQRGAESVGVAQRKRLGALQVPRDRRNENVFRIPDGGVAVAVQKVPPENRMLRTLDKVDLADDLVIVAGSVDAPGKASRGVGNRQVLRECHCRRVVAGNRNEVAGELLLGGGIGERVRSEVAKIPIVNLRGRRQIRGLGLGSRLDLPRRLIAAEEEQLVFDDGPAHYAAKLVAMEHVVFCLEEVAGVHRAGPHELEQVAVQLVRAGLGHDVHGAAGMQSVARGQSVGLDAELLQGVREGEGEVYVGECVVVVATIEQVVERVALRTEHRDYDRTIKTLASRHVAGRLDGGPAGEQHQRCRLAPVQGKLQDASLVDDLGDGVARGFGHRGLGRHFDAVGHRADLQRHIEQDAVADLQQNPGLDGRLKVLAFHFQPVGAYRQIAQAVLATLIGGCGTREPCVGLDGLHVRAGHHRSTGVGHTTMDFGDRDRLGVSLGRQQERRCESA